MISSIILSLMLLLVTSCTSSPVLPINTQEYQNLKLESRKAADKIREDVKQHLQNNNKVPIIVNKTSHIKHAYIITAQQAKVQNTQAKHSKKMRWFRTLGIVLAFLAIPVIFSLNGLSAKKENK